MLDTILNADLWFENYLLSIRAPFFLHLFNWITFFGSTVAIIVLTGIVGLYLFYSRHAKAHAIGLTTTIIGAAASSYIVKILVGRARPGGLIPSIIETSPSFPSGHATLGMALYGFLAFLLCKMYPKNTTLIVTGATLLILAIGFSRLYLGIHFPTDVLAGYLLGGLWVIIGIKIAARLPANDIVR
ncbi:MAG: phosphatase PAP2 family protein [Candidatus Paceibacterota bacterium]|jgi:undecaprenyl-diphosphatase